MLTQKIINPKTKKQKNFFMNMSNYLEKLSVTIITILTFILVGVVFLQVISRYFWKYSFLWGEELAILCFTWIVFLGTTIAVRHSEHFEVDILPNIFSKKVEIGLEIIRYIFILIISIIFIVFGINYSILGLTKYSYSTGLPMTIYYIIAPICGGLMVLFIIERITRSLCLHRQEEVK